MKVAIIGSGAMGSGIAQVAATAGCRVIIYDKQAAALQRAREKLAKIMDRLVEKGKLDPPKAQGIQERIQYEEELAAVRGADIAIEAIVEDLSVKKSVFQELEKWVAEDCLLGTNTSSLSIASIAAACQRPERVIGIHFFNPAPLMKLVEIIPALQTSPQTQQRARELIDEWGKTTVVAKDTPGFIVNRVARPFYGEALRLLDEGIADASTIDWAMTELGGFRMGPFTLMDYIGNDVNYQVTKTVFEAYYYDPRYRPSFTQRRLAEAGYLGRKSGKGYYDYSEGAKNPAPRQDKTLGDYILSRILVMLINEAADAAYYNIASAGDIELAMTKGVNYPKGLLHWADEIGLSRCVQSIDELYDEYREERYRCSPLLRKMARRGEKFFGFESRQ